MTVTVWLTSQDVQFLAKLTKTTSKICQMSRIKAKMSRLRIIRDTSCKAGQVILILVYNTHDTSFIVGFSVPTLETSLFIN